jgi:hypothetical protein
MFKWVVAALAGLYVVFVVYGDPDRIADGPVFASDSSPLENLFLASAPTPEPARVAPQRAVSDAEAVRIAIAAGAALRSERAAASSPSLRGLVSAVEAAADQPFAPTTEGDDIWFVTGTAVNLRAGPGTGSSVVAKLTLGTEARALSNPTADWVEIETTDGATRGYIFSRFLSQSRPS